MKARHITILVAILVTLAMTLALIVISRRIVLVEFAALEQKNIEADVKCTVNTLNADLQELNRTALDYSMWDDTYRWMRSREEAYARSNYSDVSLRNLKVRTVILLDKQRRVALLQSLRPGAVETNADLHVLLSAAEKLVNTQAISSVGGLVVLSEGPAFVSIHPILTTLGRGPSAGTFLMVRDVDSRLRAKISSMVELPLSIRVVDAQGTPAPQPPMNHLQATGDVDIRIVDQDLKLASTRLFDLWGQPRVLLEIQHNREIWKQAKHVEGLLLIAVLILGLLNGGLNLFLVQKLVVVRVEKLTHFARSIGTEQGLNARIELSGNDEITELGEQVNRMLDDLQSSHEKLVLAGERLQHEATHDSLTGAWNCAAALELLDREISRSEREENTVAVLMLDIDHFKDVNDRFGHAAGDQALQAIAASIAGILRTTDILARYGGEEFLVIAPSCNLMEARRLAERILLRLQSTPTSIGKNEFQSR